MKPVQLTTLGLAAALALLAGCESPSKATQAPSAAAPVETRSTTAVRTPTESGSTYARDTTFADGTTREIDRTTTRDGEGGATVERKAAKR